MLFPWKPPNTCRFFCLTLKNMSSMSSPFSSSSLPCSPSSTKISFLYSTPVYSCILPTPVTFTIYIMAITNIAILYEIKRLPLYESNTISQELICLLHDTFHFQSYYSQTILMTDQALLLIGGELTQWTFNILHLHGFHTYFTCLWPEVLFPVFSPIFQSMSPHDQERYQEIVTSTSTEPVIEAILTPIPIPPPYAPSSISSPSSLTPSLTSWIFSRPTSPIEMLIPESGFSQENTLLISSYIQHSPQGRWVMSASTQMLPSAYLKPPATPTTQCFLCHNRGHYQENCPHYQCPHCHEVASGHPSHLCMQTQCSFCKHWGHSDRVCPQWVCGDCNQPGHIVDDCPFLNLSLEQAAHIYGDRTPL